MADTAHITQIISKRTASKLVELQHQLAAEMQALAAQHSRFLGALMACDAATQRSMMLEYRDQLYVVHSTISKLCVVLDRNSDSKHD